MWLLSMKSDAIEETLQQLLGPAAGSPGLVITLRRHDEYELLLHEIADLKAERCRLQSQIRQLSYYPVMYLKALDELRYAGSLLGQLGIDTSFISSLRRRK